MATQVLLHELGHFVLDCGVDITDKTKEESCANLISLICLRRLLSINFIRRQDLNAIIKFMNDQPAEYQFGPILLENHRWEWLKWRIQKKEYTGAIHGKMPINNQPVDYVDMFNYIDGKPSFFK